MRVIIIGATGLIGKGVSNLLSKEHKVVRVGYRDGEYQLDLSSKDSIEKLYQQLGSFDAVVCTAGLANFGPLQELTDADFELALSNKLMGQVNLVRVGEKYISNDGSFTLTSGVTGVEPIPGSSSISMVNQAIEGFARAAALELGRNIRINVVSPVFAKESMEKMGMDTTGAMEADAFAPSYLESVTSKRNGEVLNVRDFV